MLFKSITLAAVASTVAAQNMSFCDKYTTALFMNNTSENQLKLLTAVVNTAVIGNCKCIASRTSPCCQTDNIQTAKARLEKPSAVSSPREPTTASKSTFFHTSTVLFSQATAVDHQA